ncbi:Rieske (2Fe-2S) protein [Streptomyces sp. NPDC097981]|uniref:Rieske (2Fe-2S) protein n=1 Tax=Streptomyces sp. NPDC097981 TaxID=3155428 RepID=UPI003332B8B0
MVCGTAEGDDLEYVIVVAKNGDYRAFDASCPHLAANLNDVGRSCCGKTLVCDSHGWEFDLETGAVIRFPGKSLPREKLEILRVIELDGEFEME